jgi:hypothetical protein
MWVKEKFTTNAEIKSALELSRAPLEKNTRHYLL